MASVSNTDQVDPNLIPLLDLVLQLIMFFVMVANFARQEINEDVKLPESQSARRPDPVTETELLFVNLDHEGRLMVAGLDNPISSISEIQFFLKDEYRRAKEAAEAKGDRSGVVNTVVVIRANADASFKRIFEVLRECKGAGFRRWQLRAIIKNEG
jgi:biopolymer transport protein ExbD